MLTPETLRNFFKNLRETGYMWQVQTPDRLLAFRKNPTPFRPIVQWLGLGLAVTAEELISDGIHPGTLDLLIKESFAVPARFAASKSDALKATMAIGGTGDLHVVHDHWPPDAEEAGGYVHYAAESEWLARACNRDLEGFIGKRVLDLGCSSGALAFEVGGVADKVIGLDISERSIEWARASSAAYGFTNMRFEAMAIGSKQAEALVSTEKWDVAVMNPPMVVPAQDVAWPHRDGGALGVELPLLFLEFSHRHLREGGEVLMLATNPIVHGKNIFFDKLDRRKWDLIEKRCIHPQFNQAVARKQNYAEQGIQNIELWYLHLKACV